MSESTSSLFFRSTVRRASLPLDRPSLMDMCGQPCMYQGQSPPNVTKERLRTAAHLAFLLGSGAGEKKNMMMMNQKSSEFRAKKKWWVLTAAAEEKSRIYVVLRVMSSLNLWICSSSLFSYDSSTAGAARTSELALHGTSRTWHKRCLVRFLPRRGSSLWRLRRQ